jgi:hypothetical protein
MPDLDFLIEFNGFAEGNAPLAHIDSQTFVGNRGQASDMKADVISKPGFLTQSPALSALTNGTQAGAVSELIRFILDQPTASDTTFGIGTTKLFKMSSTAVASGGSPSWPQALTNCTQGESVIRLKANLYAFFNKASGGEIAKMPLDTETIDQTWGSVADAALQKAPHPVAAKEDVMLFGNGRYVGVYVEGLATLDTVKLDFGEGSEVADVVFNANMWWIAVNYGEGKRSQIYMYDGSAISNILSDEAGVGEQEIGFLYVKDGIIYVCYKDLTSSTFIIGRLNGRAIEPLRYFSGTLPDHRQKALYKNTIIFLSSTDVWSFGAVVNQLPLQISKLCDGGYATLGAVASPFGTPWVSSTDGATNFQLSKFSGYSLDSFFKSVLVNTTKGRLIGKIDTVIVTSKPLGADAKCTIELEGNQGADGYTSNTLTYTGTGKTREVFRTIIMKEVEDLRVIVDFAEGNATNDCPIRKIECLGTFVER